MIIPLMIEIIRMQWNIWNAQFQAFYNQLRTFHHQNEQVIPVLIKTRAERHVFKIISMSHAAKQLSYTNNHDIHLNFWVYMKEQLINLTHYTIKQLLLNIPWTLLV